MATCVVVDFSEPLPTPQCALCRWAPLYGFTVSGLGRLGFRGVGFTVQGFRVLAGKKTVEQGFGLC